MKIFRLNLKYTRINLFIPGISLSKYIENTKVYGEVE